MMVSILHEGRLYKGALTVQGEREPPVQLSADCQSHRVNRSLFGAQAIHSHFVSE